MKLENAYAIIESLAEWELFNPTWKILLYEIDAVDCEGIVYNILENKERVTKEQVKEKLQLKKGDNYFQFDSMESNSEYKILLPLYMWKHSNNKNSFDRENNNRIYTVYDIPINILTINKPIQQLYELGQWCNLFK